MLDTSARLLRLLALLQSRPGWTGPLLADRLGVTTRTVRNDVERLRRLGYPVHGSPGAAGGYRLGAGAALPPLLLDDEEAVAVALGLRTAADGSVAGLGEVALRALAKLEQVLPSRLRHRVDALHAAAVAVPRPGPGADPAVLARVAAAVRAGEGLRFDYESFDGTTSVRTVEPHRLVHTRGRWYLVAWDADRGDWRTFRADRIRPRLNPGPRGAPRPGPEGGAAAFVARGLGTATWRYRARVTVHAPAAEVAARLPPSVAVTPIDERTCAVEAGSDSPRALALWLGMLDADFDAGDDPVLAEHVRAVARRYARAAGERSPGGARVADGPTGTGKGG
ncbi:MAG TPA: WYL domain-containing protein [Acidimicrobiales bacterium]